MTEEKVEKCISDHGFAQVYQNTIRNQNLLRAKVSFKKGDLIHSFSDSILSDTVTYLTVQINEKHHVSLQPEFLQYINHSCDPNASFDVDSMNLIALTDIEEHEEMTFFYPSTEWKMVQPFDCFCGTEMCLGKIEGASFIPLETLKKYKVSSFISRKAGFCYCGSNDLFSKCCKDIIEGVVPANSAEQLMRSRYSAYAVSATDYLLKTAHPSIRRQQSIKEIQKWADENDWQKLEIIKTTTTTVEFKAYYLDPSKKQQIHHEKSTFVFEEGEWLYLSGEFE